MLSNAPSLVSCPLKQRGATNISIKINTTKEFVTDLTHDQEQDNESAKIEVRL